MQLNISKSDKVDKLLPKLGLFFKSTSGAIKSFYCCHALLHPLLLLQQFDLN